MNDRSAAVPLSLVPRADQTRLNPNVIGACLRSAFIEALYDDCGDLLPEAACAPEPRSLPIAAE
jgi:hypothetical protein